MTVRVLGLASGVTGLEDLRHAVAALVFPAGSMQARGGVFAGTGGDLVTVSAMGAKITPFYGWADGTSAALQAGYDLASDADEPVNFTDGESGVARIDRVIVRVRDDQYDGGGVDLGSVEVLKGQASGAATALPPNSELMWEVTVPAGASAGTGGINFTTARTDKRRWTVAVGGLLPVKDQAERDAAASPYDGMAIWRRDRKWVEVHVGGGAWRVRGIANVASAADRAAITHPYDGQVIARTDMTWLEQYKAGAWRVMGVAYVAAFADLATQITHPYQGQVAIVTANSGGEYRYDGAKWQRAAAECEIRRLADLPVANGIEFVVPWDDDGAGVRDPLGVWSPGLNHRFVIPVGLGGRWEFHARVMWAFSGAGARAGWFVKNNVTAGAYRLGADGALASSATETLSDVYWQGNMADGDFMELRVLHTAGVTLNIQAANTNDPLRIYIRRLGPAL